MIINHNLGAMNANRQMGVNAANANKSMEKLSSGLRINKAGDDAAGLAISEKMRGQIRGLDQASANAQDGISMIQTAEGALSETHSILQRMRELAVQGATDTNTLDDRNKIQGEVDQLAKEITRISNTTEFNTQNLLAGGLNDKFHIGANEGQNVGLSIAAMDAKSLGVSDDLKSSGNLLATTTKVTSVTDVSRGLEAGTGYKIEVSKTSAVAGAVSQDIETKAGTHTLAADNNYTGTADATYTVKIATTSITGGSTHVSSIQYSKDNGTSWSTVSVTGDSVTVDGMKFTLADTNNTTNSDTVGIWKTDDQYHFTATAAKATVQLQDTTGTNIGSSTTVHNGDTSATIGSLSDGKTVKANFDFSTLATGTTGDRATFDITSNDSAAAVVNDGQVNTEAETYAGINVSSQDKASLAITKINNAITTVSQERSKLGAYQNRLEHTIANLGTSSENLTSAESRIRDVDMAKEMSTFSKNNILSQAAQAMLAQANQQPQQVLQLLR